MRRRATERVRASCSPEEVLQQLGVRAGVRPVLGVERILLSSLPEPLDRDPLAGPRISRGVARRIDVRALDRLRVVLDADSIAEDALVTQIAVLVLGVETERLQSGVGLQVKRKRVLTRRLAARGSVVEPCGRGGRRWRCPCSR